MNARALITVAFALAAALAGPWSDQARAERYKHTYPQPPKTRPDDPMRVFPGSQVPENPERWVWRLKRGKASSQGPSNGTVRTYHFDTLGRGSMAGTAPEGLEVKLDQFRQSGRQIFYGVTVDGKQMWVSGFDIAADAYTPPAK